MPQDIFDQLKPSRSPDELPQRGRGGDIFDQLKPATKQATAAVAPPEKTTKSLPKWERPPGRTRTASEQAGAEAWAKRHAPAVLTAAGSMVAPELGPEMGILGRAALSTLGGAAGDVAGRAGTGQKQSATGSLGVGLAYGAGPELIGGALIKAGESMTPTAIKGFATKLFAGRMDVAGQAIDHYLSQPSLATIKVDVEKPIIDFMDKEIARADRVGAKSLAKRLADLKADWTANYNLKSATLAEANAFKRDITKYASFEGEANKITLNRVQKQAVGITSGLIEKSAPGVKPLNEAYANLAGGMKAAKSAARKATSGFTGLGLSAAGATARNVGAVTPSALRLFLASQGIP